MLKRLTLTLAIITASVAVLSAASGGTGQKKPRQLLAEREIRAVLDEQAAAWNRRDLEGYMKGYWHSDDLTFYSGGSKVSGWQPTLERYRNRYQGEGREMGQLDFSELRIELLGPDSAFVRGRWRLKMQTSELGGLFTLIFRKLPEGWRITHDHTSASS